MVPAPASTAEDLTTPPTTNWITNGGTTFNQRYSPLGQINRFNVKDVKAAWKTPMGSGKELKNGGQTQIHCERDGEVIRIISARKATAKERKHYTGA